MNSAGLSEHAMPAAVARFFAASRAGDARAWAAAFAADGAFHHPVGQPPVRGREAIEALIVRAIAGFGRFDGLQAVETHRSDPHVAVSWRGAGVSPTGGAVVWSGITGFELDDAGLIANARVYGDLATVAAQLSAR
ncbi:nuclear transport factor 2 family protein [Solihabitans fulvus]|nr:nuclear transport factor 2 family protein [Solihabitans fulvus]